MRGIHQPLGPYGLAGRYVRYSPVVAAGAVSPPGGQAAVAGAPQNGKGQPAAPANPFIRSSQEIILQGDQRTVQITAAPQPFGPIDIPAAGYMAHIVLEVIAAGGVGGAATVAITEDAPFNVLRDITLTDVNGRPIQGLVDGHDLFLENVVGGYTFMTDPRQDPETYVAPAVGAGASGDFRFKLRVPVQLTGRDGLGALPNMNAAQTYKLSYTVAASSAIYSTAPATTLPSVTIRCWLEAWALPGDRDLRGNPNTMAPPALNTTQFWAKSVLEHGAGDVRLQLPRRGNLIRNLIFIERTLAGARTTTNFPDPLRFEWENRNVFVASRSLLRSYFWERSGVALPTGVFALDYTHDLDYRIGDEMRDLYLETHGGSKLEIIGSFGAAGRLTVLTNDVTPAGDVYAEAN